MTYSLFLQNSLQLIRLGTSQRRAQVRQIDGVVHNPLSAVQHLLNAFPVQRVQGDDVSDSFDDFLRQCL